MRQFNTISMSFVERTKNYITTLYSLMILTKMPDSKEINNQLKEIKNQKLSQMILKNMDKCNWK